VDCIEMLPATGADAVWGTPRAKAARGRFDARRLRLARDKLESTERRERKAAEKLANAEPEKRAAIQAAIGRARARRAAAERSATTDRGNPE
jgi:Na+-translocating ferredoxin:NAD+ oxidoreductase RnfC subunit